MLVDLDVVDANIARMASFVRRGGFALRPHIKTHKSVAMAERQMRAGAVGICCATASEAEVMIAGGIRDVLLAYPLVGPRKLERVARLLGSSSLTLISDSKAVTATYRQLAQSIGRSIRVMIEIDTGMHQVSIRNAVPWRRVIGMDLSRLCRDHLTRGQRQRQGPGRHGSRGGPSGGRGQGV